jgi:hypothetical protein
MMETDYDCVMGIDPGVNGGIAIWRAGAMVRAIKMPRELSDITKLFDYEKSVSKRQIVFIEKVNLRPDDVDSPGKAFRVQRMLADHQRLKDLIEFAGIPYVLVHPMSWMSYLHLRKKGEEKKERKNRLKEAAGYYYPFVRTSLWNADALLIMHFGRLKLRDDPKWVKQNIPKDIIHRIPEKLF